MAWLTWLAIVRSRCSLRRRRRRSARRWSRRRRTPTRTALRALLQKGANVNAAEADGTTALHWASYRDDVESADLLIRAGAKVNAANDLGATPLWTASLNGSAAMVRRLLDGRRRIRTPRSSPARRR